MPAKSEIVFTFPDCMGGVASFNRNIVNHSSLKNNFLTHVILIKSKEDKRPVFTDQVKADRVSRFSFSVRENQYFVYKRLNRLIGNNAGCIVCDNDTTLITASIFNNPKNIIMLVHDYFYVRYALLYEKVIDAAIAHSSFFKDILCAALPGTFTTKSYYIPYGVEQPLQIHKEKNQQLQLVFLGRLVKEKGILTLINIEKILSDQGVQVHWTIIGSGSGEAELKSQWNNKQNVSFLQPATTAEVYNILKWQDLLVLPTLFEGTPVSILECIANGVVPVVSDLPGGIRDIVNTEIGFRCAVNDPTAFANSIICLHKDRSRLEEMQNKAIRLSRERYDIDKAADDYFNLFSTYAGQSQSQKTLPVKLSRLDKPFLPNTLVTLIRSIGR